MTTEKTLNKEDQAKIEKDLLERKAFLVGDLESIAKKETEGNKDHYKAAFPEYGNKADENAQEISDYSSNLAKEEILEKNLRDINSALGRLKDGTYGKCKYCQNPINLKRLEARPTASSCIHCKTELQNS